MTKLNDYRLMPINELKEHPENPRIHPDSAIDKLQKSIEEFGFTNPVLVSKDGFILAGHARVKASKKAGLEEVPAIILDLDGDMASLYLIADNRLQEETDWDMPVLKDLIERLDTGALDLELSGFTNDEIEDLMSQFHMDDEEIRDDEFDVSEALDEIEEPSTKVGQLWRLGRHRLLVGDSTNESEVKKLMGENLADMVFTDPPYNVDYVGKTGEALKISNDKMDDVEFLQFLLDSFNAMAVVTKAGGIIYVCHADTKGLQFRQAFVEAGFYLSQCLVWVKNMIVPGYSDYQWRHEPILYGWREGGPHKRLRDRKQSTVFEADEMLSIAKEKDHTLLTITSGDSSMVLKVPEYEVVYSGTEETQSVWRFNKPLRNGEHPTMKPIPLCARAILNSSDPGDNVLDPFGGSGSTLMACEQTGRSCFTMEYDPKYAEVIIKRWESFTGEKAIKISD